MYYRENLSGFSLFFFALSAVRPIEAGIFVFLRKYLSLEHDWCEDK